MEIPFQTDIASFFRSVFHTNAAARQCTGAPHRRRLEMNRHIPQWIYGIGLVTLTAVPITADETVRVEGFLYEVLDGIGTKDEGPAYFLQQFNGTDLAIIKNASQTKEDSTLQSFVGKKVSISGERTGQAILYQRVEHFNADGSGISP